MASDTDKLSQELAEGIVEGLEIGEKTEDSRKAVNAFQSFFKEQILNTKYLRCLHYVTINDVWYLCLRRVYETTDHIDTMAFLVEFDVPAGGNKSYSIDLTETTNCCVCPKYTASADLGDYVKLTNLLNESPVDFKAEKYKDKYAARNRPLPVNIGESLRYGYDYVVFPKRKVKVTLSNTHSTEEAHAVFYADYMRMNIDMANRYMINIYEEMVDNLVGMMFEKVEARVIGEE